jgi:ParB family chromosome partitioning protein|tara:strand:+ start:48 stop:590 length:543 start_codon:yes stop_codon:yes gene_type:complete
MLEIQYIATDNLIPYINNSRTHSEAQIHQITASIVEFGFTNPVLIDEKAMIIAGHGRIEAAKVLGIDEVPTITLKGLTETQRKAYIIADNKLALNAGWDIDALSIEINQLSDLNFDLDILGFDIQELTSILDGETTETELKEESYSEIFNIVIECKDEQEQEKIFNKLDTEGYKCRVQSL